MDRGDIVGGNKSTQKSQEKPQGVIVSPNGVGATAQRVGAIRDNVGGHSGAMSQQRCDSGGASTPQQFVHLVGCRERKPTRQQG